MQEGDSVSAMDKDLWEYFATLYKNSNKGIKGRGKDRRIFTTNRSGEDEDDSKEHDSRRSRSCSSDVCSHDTSDQGSDVAAGRGEKDDSSSSSGLENDDQNSQFASDINCAPTGQSSGAR